VISSAFPTRTISILGFSKSHGPDLRLAAIGGAAGPIDAAASRRQLGPGWSSRLLQAALTHLLTDPGAVAAVEHARDRYANRRAAVVGALRGHGIDLADGDGINLWLPVADEQHALLSLAARGIGVAPGAPFRVLSEEPHVRVTIATIDDDPAELARLADLLAAAAAPPRNTPTA